MRVRSIDERGRRSAGLVPRMNFLEWLENREGQLRVTVVVLPSSTRFPMRGTITGTRPRHVDPRERKICARYTVSWPIHHPRDSSPCIVRMS